MNILKKNCHIPLNLNGSKNHEFDFDLLMGRDVPLVYCIFGRKKNKFISKDLYVVDVIDCDILLEAELKIGDLLNDYGEPTWKRNYKMLNNTRRFKEWIYIID